MVTAGGSGAGSWAVVLCAPGTVEIEILHGDHDRLPDLTVIDTLAKLQLVANRLGWSLRLRGSCDDLRALLDFCGLAATVADEVALGVEVVGETERGEQLGVEEVVEPGDPIA
jgi:hypothetical protein